MEHSLESLKCRLLSLVPTWTPHMSNKDYQLVERSKAGHVCLCLCDGLPFKVFGELFSTFRVPGIYEVNIEELCEVWPFISDYLCIRLMVTPVDEVLGGKQYFIFAQLYSIIDPVERLQCLSCPRSDEEWCPLPSYVAQSVGTCPSTRGTLKRNCDGSSWADADVALNSVPRVSESDIECPLHRVSSANDSVCHCTDADRSNSLYRGGSKVKQDCGRGSATTKSYFQTNAGINYSAMKLVFIEYHKPVYNQLDEAPASEETGPTRENGESANVAAHLHGANMSSHGMLPTQPDEVSVKNSAVHMGNSYVTGFSGSILNVYRTLFKSSVCKNGVPCLRHADIPGLSRSLKFSQKDCSDLDVAGRSAPEPTFPHADKHPNRASLASFKPKVERSSGHDSPAELSMDRGGLMVERDGPRPSIPLGGTSTSKPNYGSNTALISSVTPLLHAQAFSKIILALDIHVGSSDNQSLIPFLFILGLSYFKLLEYKEAKARFLRCEHICVANKKMGDSSLCNFYLGDIELSSHNFLAASAHYKMSAVNYCSDNVAGLFHMVPPSLSSVYAKHGAALRNASKMVDAIQEYKLAIKEARTGKDELAANTSLGNVYQSLGENTTALAHYERSVELAEKLCDHISLGWAHGNMGNAYLGLFQKDKALYHLQKSMELTIKYEPTPQAIGRTYNNLGTAHQSLGNLEKAQDYYDRALGQAVYGNDKPGQARVYGNMGNVLMLRKKYGEAAPKYAEVLLLSTDRSTLSTAHHNRGCAYYEWAEHMMAAMYDQQEPKVVSVSTKEDGKENEEQDEELVSAKPLKVYIHGLDFSNDCSVRPHKATDDIQNYYRLACKDLSEVVEYHEGHLESIKGSSRGLTLSVSLFETNSRTFHRYQDCLVNLGDCTKALSVAEQSRARTLGELMLKRRSWHLQYPLTSPMPYDQVLATVQRSEHPVLYLSYTGARLLGWVFVSREDDPKMNMFEVPLKDDQFDGKSFDYHLRYSLTEALVEGSLEMYHEVGSYDEVTSSPAQELYSLIASPLLLILNKCGAQNAKKLVIISDSYTALIPYSGLHDLKTDTFLGDHFSFQLMPSLLTMSLLDQLPDTNIVHLPMDPHDMCIVGNPNIPQFKYKNEVWNLGKLPHAKREAQSVARILKTTPILDAQATKSAVLMRIFNAKVIHLATHGSASAGFLAFGMMVPRLNKLPDAEGVLLYPEEVEKLNICPALVVLSSCDSGRGTFKADGIQGMARAFILAGSQAVLTTLWRVPDESAAIFMQFFYQYMMDGLESTRALQKAILSIRCFSKYSQFIHWSGYQLTGRDISFRYTIPEVTHILDKHMGPSNIFPCQHVVDLLEAGLVDVSCFPTDVQVCYGCGCVRVHVCMCACVCVRVHVCVCM